ncbi:MAG TPA: pyridoxal-phosphate dependent enzyme, partial [Ktedonobacteraceae bacterium]|nr:pyridoxal-phosphate dependent enzyme [Ktedonobacteraceae bacterium]
MGTRHYNLTCPICQSQFEDDGFVLECASRHAPALLVTDYSAKRLECDAQAFGLYRYHHWLPIGRPLCHAGKTITYHSDSLSRLTGLPHLWIAFNGYWPEKGATLETATFKELEACSVLARLPTGHNKVLVLASAGNTAAAFVNRCSQSKLPCLIIVPQSGLERMLFAEQPDSCVKLVVLGGSADYHDAITLAQHLSQRPGFFPEGGVKNVARRDGLGTTMLAAVETIGRLPDHYFQAIGSGTGGIAAYEAAQRLIGDGRFGQLVPRLMLSQNFP